MYATPQQEDAENRRQAAGPPASHPEAAEESPRAAFQRSVEDGQARLHRTWPALFATGAVGGMDVSVGVFALLVVEEATGSHLLGALAFAIGFIALLLARSELFTENFFVPIAAVAGGRAGVRHVVRLWLGTLVFNLLGGWVFVALVMSAFPRVRPTALELAAHIVELGVSWPAFASAVIGGVVITLMTWMEHSTEALVGKLAAVISIAFVLAAAPLNHAVVISIEMFAALQVGAPFGYLDWLAILAWAALGNMIGGIGLVTVLRLVQVGRRPVQEAKADAPPEP